MTLVHPEITANAAAIALTASLDFNTSSAPVRNFSIRSSGTVSSDLRVCNRKEKLAKF